jgi:hypothetical protein
VTTRVPTRIKAIRVTRGDVAIIILIVLFGWLALAIRASVADLADMATGITDAGTAIQRSGESTADALQSSTGRAADAIAAVPLVGSGVAGSVRETGRTSADAIRRETRTDAQQLITTGRQGRQDTQQTARLIGWFAFLVPAVLLLVMWLPRRYAQITAAAEGQREPTGHMAPSDPVRR